MVIITGATGFLGRHLAERFHAEGLEVIATGRNPSVGQELIDQGIDFRAADLSDATSLTRTFGPADCLVHCAGKSADWGSYDEFYEANVIGTRNVVAACQRHAIRRLIFVSTPSMYYSGEDRFAISEDEPLPRQLAHYGKTKLTAERELVARQRDGLKVIILRPRAVYGPHDRTIAPRMRSMARRPRLPLINAGRALVDVTYVDNFVEATRRCLAAPQSAWNQIYNISNGQPLPLRDWIAEILKIFGLPFRPLTVPEATAKAIGGVLEALSKLPFGPQQPVLTRFSVGYMAKSMTLSLDKARQVLGYRPPVTNAESFARYGDWVAKQRASAGR